MPKTSQNMLYDFGLVGLGVMGRNFTLNLADQGFSVFALETHREKIDALKQERGGKTVGGTTRTSHFARQLTTPRKIMLLVLAGAPVDAAIEDLLPQLNQGDLIIDAGNSFFAHTDRRTAYLKKKGIDFTGCGISGGASGARFGASIMVGGSRACYELVKPALEAASAKVRHEPCVALVGSGSAGHYVKMVHNGIEYAMMQLIAEVYDILKRALHQTNEQIHGVFERWNKGRLQSFLMEITAEIFRKRDESSAGSLIDRILDKAKQKGTGRWASQNAMDLGTPTPTIDAAVNMREISAMKAERLKAEAVYGEKATSTDRIKIDQLESALYVSFIISYAQGMTQLAHASETYGYGLNPEEVAKIWRGGCIISSVILEDVRNAYRAAPNLTNLLLDEDFASGVKGGLEDMKEVVCFAVKNNIPVMGLTASLNYLQAFTSGRLPLHLTQAQRDYFGSHTYERLDKEGSFHTDWSRPQ